MRNIIVSANLTVDGVMESPEHWAFSYHGDDVAAANLRQMYASDAVLFGRVTYEAFAAFWPYQSQDTSGIAAYLNRIPKFVVSTTLPKAEWQNSTIIHRDILKAIADLKQQPGKDMVVVGSATLAQSLLQADLVDEYQLWVHPLVLGSGKRLFAAGNHANLKLVEAKTFSSGVVLLRYQPIRKGA